MGSLKGQLSAEMLILLAVILALVLLVSSQLLKTTQAASDKVEQSSESAFGKADAAIEASKGDAGDYWISDGDCKSGTCDSIEGRCA